MFDAARLLASALELALALLFGLACVWVGIRAFDRMTPRVDELAEVKRGNAAVGIVLASVVLSIALVVRGGVEGMALAFVGVGAGAAAWALAVALALLRLAVALTLATLGLRLAYWAFDQVTAGIDEQAEIARGNVAVALLMGAVLVGVSLVIAAAVGSVTAAIAW